MLRRGVSHLDSHETICGPSAIASGFPNPYCVIDALLGPLRLMSPLPSFTLPASVSNYGLPGGAEVGITNPSLSTSNAHCVLDGGFGVR